MELKENAAYIKGLAEGLGIDNESKEGKVISALLELVSDMADKIEVLEAECEELREHRRRPLLAVALHGLLTVRPERDVERRLAFAVAFLAWRRNLYDDRLDVAEIRREIGIFAV